jgi:hypothetical protein
MSVIFFGCWGDYQHRVKEVLSSLYKYIKRNDVTNVIVAGDNYYIDKDEDKQKKYVPGEASSIIGLLHLATMDVHTDVLAGNHEYDRIEKSKIIGEHQKDLSEEDECFILQEETTTFDKIHSENFNFRTIHTDVDKSFLLLNDVLYLFLDSSMYEYKLPECYASYPEKYNSEILGRLKQKQIEKMRTILDMNAGKYKKITCCAHHPLYIFRVKDGVYKDPVPNYEILSALCQFLPVEEIDYLCADFHVYQESHLHVTHKGKPLAIHQYIVGTGGTELDEFPSKIVFEELQPAILSSKSLKDLLQGSVVSELENGVSIDTPANHFKVDAVHIKSDRSYGYAVIRPNEPLTFIKVMEGDPVKQEKKKEKKDKKTKVEPKGGTRKRKRKQTKRK